MRYYQEALSLKEDLIHWRRHIHENPEVGLATEETARYIKGELEKMGYSPEPCGCNGIIASLGQGPKTLLLRADMDALEQTEESGLPFASQNPGKSHGCGHDLHSAMLLGAAKILKDHEEDLTQRVLLMFQPAEEIFAGAQSMIDDGLLDRYPVDYAFAVHNMPTLPVGTVALTEGPFMPSVDGFTITIHGQGCHGASAQEGVDPINIGAHLHLALQALLAREIDYQTAALLTIGSFQAGNIGNIIPDQALLSGTLRAMDSTVRRFLKERLETLSRTTAEGFRGTAEVHWDYAIPANVTDSARIGQLKEALTAINLAEEAAGEKAVLTLEEGGLLNASEDFALVADRVPSAFLRIGSRSENEEDCNILHNPRVILNEEALIVGAAVYSAVALN